MGRTKDYSGLQLLLIVLITLFSVGYIMFWWGLVTPIMTIANAYDTHTLTAGLIGWEVIKFLLREFLGGLVFYLGVFVFLARISK